MTRSNLPNGIVYLVGAGPGDPGLITVRGRSLLRGAQVVVYDRLIDARLLAEAPDDAELIDVGKRRGAAPLTQDEINEVLVHRARLGLRVVRLKGGDPFVFGRGFEELTACRQAGIPCVVVPGVSSAIAAPESAGIPLTLRGVARSFAVVTAETAPNTAPPDFAQMAGVDSIVILMGRARLAAVMQALLEAGRDADTPAACIERATTRHQRVVAGTLSTLAETAEKAGLAAPVVTVVGEAAANAVETAGVCREALGGWPLAGKRIVVTRPRSASGPLIRRLRQQGAIPILCPLTRINYPELNEDLDDAIRKLDKYQWAAYTSMHGVKAFWRRLAALGFDARRLGGCKIAALGAATARELRLRGITPDVAPRGDAQRLAHAIVSYGPGCPGAVLWPRGDLARSTLRDQICAAGGRVDAPVAYQTIAADPPRGALERLDEGVDAIVFYSPSAVLRFAELGLVAKDACVVCIGQTTADQARESGLRVDVVAESPDNDAMMAALERCCEAKVPA